MLGPVDYVVVGFQGNNFDGKILEELGKAIDSGVIRLIDLVFVIKDENGQVAIAEVTDQEDDIKQAAAKLGFSDEMPLFSEADVQKIGDKMQKDTAAGILVIEQLWAKDLKKALLDKNAILLAEGRLHPDMVQGALDEVKQVKEPVTA